MLCENELTTLLRFTTRAIRDTRDNRQREHYEGIERELYAMREKYRSHVELIKKAAGR